MGKQVEDYIKLKGISNKFNEVSESITEDLIRELIRERLKEKIDEAIGTIEVYMVQEIIDNWIDSNSLFIERAVSDSLTRKLK